MLAFYDIDVDKNKGWKVWDWRWLLLSEVQLLFTHKKRCKGFSDNMG